ncbi:hypothetical protein COCCADRAFT_40761 [Bipolaris zeicola 26-R-13]|uniref:Uncharacterized protein n=1 Tax=Cochliobolus carbonum (strain 26-R-13) TaxID=930089 RepID=W6Y199_COCC2|nr:uncharacterized protein COCCADRAFT_40761 [Bipolaris zeicola 26-R-13]EUC28774.1 hypothetical protein COCCADRAFT_40761 [Bipolaris zeicola 26-R-13]
MPASLNSLPRHYHVRTVQWLAAHWARLSSRHRLRYFHANPTDSPAAHSLRYSQKVSSTPPSPTPRELQCPKTESDSKPTSASTLSFTHPHPTCAINQPRPPRPFVPTQAKKAASPYRHHYLVCTTLGLAGLRACRRSAKPHAPGPKDKGKNGFPTLRQAIE